MAKRVFLDACLLVALAALPAASHAAVIHVNCALGQKIAAALAPAIDGDTIAVSGTCAENIVVVRDGITIAKDPAVAAAAAGIRGQVTVVGRRVVISLLSILGPEPPLPTGLIAGVWATNGASVFLDRTVVAQHTVAGILAGRNASVVTDRVSVLNNAGDGVVAQGGATIQLDSTVTTLASSVTNNGGRGVVVDRGSSVSIHGAPAAPIVISGNAGIAVFAADGGSVLIVHASISAPVGQSGVVAALNSTARIQASTVTAVNEPAIVATDSSSVTMIDTSATSAADSAAGGTVGAFRTSSVRLLGGNTISNTAASFPGGNLHPALEAIDMGSLRTDSGTAVGFAPDIITGATDALLVGNLSTAHLNQGVLSGDVTVNQRSTLRLRKTGALALGVTGNIALTQGSAGFFEGAAGVIFTAKPVSCGDPETSVAGAAALSSGKAISCTGF
jgi:hypothetical protein